MMYPARREPALGCLSCGEDAPGLYSLAAGDGTAHIRHSDGFAHPLAPSCSGGAFLIYRMNALARIVLGGVNIAATTALQAINPNGREIALRRGANIVMPILTDGARDHRDVRGCTRWPRCPLDAMWMHGTSTPRRSLARAPHTLVPLQPALPSSRMQANTASTTSCTRANHASQTPPKTAASA